jgi:hypothetical protein
MKPFDRRHFFAFLRDFDSVSDQQQPAIDARQTGKDGQHRLCPNPRELIQFQAGAMEEVQYAIITGVGKPEGAQEAGDAQQTVIPAMQVINHRKLLIREQAGRRARAAFSQWIQSFMPASRKGVDK